jgi:hypothetical protein
LGVKKVARLWIRKTQVTVFPESGSSTVIDKLRIKFEIEKTNESTPNNGKIEIYNLNDRSRGVFESKNTRVALMVGYEENAETVFIGDIVKVRHVRSGCDIITRLEAEDGTNRFQNSYLDKGYPPNVSKRQVYDDCIAAMGLAKGSVIGIPTTKYTQGVSVQGMARDHLNTMCENDDLEWSIQDETVQIIPKTGFSLDSVIVLDSTSGLVGVPTKTDDGVEFESLIQPSLKIGRKVQIKSKFLTGVYKIRKVTHSGDSQRGSDYRSKCEASA